jgi:hypothetical protein
MSSVLLWREALSVTRNPADVAGRMLIFTWISVLIGGRALAQKELAAFE